MTQKTLVKIRKLRGYALCRRLRDEEMKAMNEQNERTGNITTIERLTKAGRKLGLKGQAGKNGYLYYWAHGLSCTDLDATNYADALHALECEAAVLEECEKAEEQYFNDLVKEYARG